MPIPLRTVRTFFLLLFCCALIACAHRPDAQDEQQQRINALARELGMMAPAAPQQDAQHLATAAVTTAARLRAQYGVTLAPWLHNVEVNTGTKPRGLCFHYAHDLYEALQPQVAPYWQVQFVQAKPKEILEHNAIVITARGKPWDTGIVLDGWRNAGVLYYGPVTADKYPWQPKGRKSKP
jgi:hypothetical protein